MLQPKGPTSSHADILGGALVFQGTREPVQTLPDSMIDGFTVQEFLAYFPSVRREDAVEFLNSRAGMSGEDPS
jgi:uncharacterized protein (DUF433 family)